MRTLLVTATIVLAAQAATAAGGLKVPDTGLAWQSGLAMGAPGLRPGRVPAHSLVPAHLQPDRAPLALGWRLVGQRPGLRLHGELSLAAQAGTAPRLGQPLGTGLDEQWRELRLRPLLQLGLRYEF